MKDFCTLFPDTVFGNYIGDCCKDHDNGYIVNGLREIIFGLALGLLFYFAEGSWNWILTIFIPFMFKFTFDWKLFICVSRKAWYMFFVGIAMFLAVSTIGSFFWIYAQAKKIL